MKKLLIVLVYICMLLFLSCTQDVQATSVADDSARIYSKKEVNSIKTIKQKNAIRRVLERYNSPLVGQESVFLSKCQEYNLDCYLVVAIAGLESGFGNHIAMGTYNAWGFGGGYMHFDSWEHGIHIVSHTLREKYIDRGATTIEAIARIYAPPSTTWASKVRYFINVFEKEENKVSIVDTI